MEFLESSLFKCEKKGNLERNMCPPYYIESSSFIFFSFSRSFQTGYVDGLETTQIGHSNKKYTKKTQNTKRRLFGKRFFEMRLKVNFLFLNCNFLTIIALFTWIFDTVKYVFSIYCLYFLSKIYSYILVI